MAQRKGGAFIGTVGVENPATAVGIGLIPGTHRSGADLLAADQYLAQAGKTARVIRTQRVEQRNGHEQVIDLLCFQHCGQQPCVLQVCVGNDDAATAIEQRCPQFEVTGVKRRVGQAGETVACTNLDVAVGPGQTQQAALAHFHCLGGAGSARGVEQKTQLGEVIRHRLWRMIRVIQQRLDADVPATQRRHSIRIFAQGDQPDTPPIVQHQFPTP